MRATRKKIRGMLCSYWSDKGSNATICDAFAPTGANFVIALVHSLHIAARNREFPDPTPETTRQIFVVRKSRAGMCR